MVSDNDSNIQQVARVLRQTAPTGSRVILLGSYAKGKAGPDSDLDFMVIEPFVADRHAEINRLTRAIRPLRLPVDVLVASEAVFSQWKDHLNTVYNEVATTGKVLYG